MSTSVRVFLLGVALLGAPSLRAAEDKPVATNPASPEKAFETKEFKGKDGKTLLYRLLRPTKVAKTRHYPLVVFLHGAGERGDDNKAQLKHVMKDFLVPTVREKYPCYIIAPQCPKNSSWMGGRRGPTAGKPSEALKLVLELIPAMLKELPGADPDRVYVAGLSMGGFGTWELLQRAPELFAAGVPICGGGDESQAAKVAKVPVWAFHGEKDPVVPADLSTRMVAAVKKAGGKAQLTIYPGVGHDSWTPVFRDPKVLEWMFAQKRSKS